MDNGKVTVVVGGQAGSEGKGAIAARLHKDHPYGWAVRVGGPNAGHTVVDREGHKFAFRHLPVAAVIDPEVNLVIAAGSEVDPRVLREEIELAEGMGHEVTRRLYVDYEATLLEERHAVIEGGILTGTTGKGVGAARAARAMREAKTWKEYGGMYASNTQEVLRVAQAAGDSILIEGTQGYVLGSRAGFYPYCTSGDCKAIDFMAQAGLVPQEVETWLIARTYPIRIAGKSGPLPGETSWEELGLTPEITTVTKKVRRVGAWNPGWVESAVRANGGSRVKVALTFADYWWPSLFGCRQFVNEESELAIAVRSRLDKINNQIGAQVRMLGTSPDSQILWGENGESE